MLPAKDLRSRRSDRGGVEESDGRGRIRVRVVDGNQLWSAWRICVDDGRGVRVGACLWMKSALWMTDGRSARIVWPIGSDVVMTETWTRAEIGALGEQLAVEHLTALGLRVIDRNWRCRYGELDVIAADAEARVVVFVEVKTRTSDAYGGVAQAVTPQKVRRLRRLAGLWLAEQSGSWSEVRIDVVGVRIGQRPTPELTHLQGVG